MTDVVVVGAGLAGLTCALDLTRAGIDCLVVEASDGIGGRVRTDSVDGFLLDRGFQILLTAYPEVQRRLDLDALALRRFEPGTLIRRDDSFHRVADPLRRPLDLPATLGAPIGTVADKLRLARMVVDVRAHPVGDLLRRPDRTTSERLADAGFTGRMVESFWRPLFAGIQLDPELQVSSRRFDVILRMLATGPTGVPARGMGAVPAQLAAALPAGAVRLAAPVTGVGGSGVVLDDGERLGARAVVVATDGPTAHRLLGDRVPDPGSRAATCCWFSSTVAPVKGPWLLLAGDAGGAGGPAKNVAVMSEVSPSYAPSGRSLIAAAVPGVVPDAGSIVHQVRRQLAGWFDSSVGDWEHLRTDVIPHGQPRQSPPFGPKQAVDLGGGVFVCGDHRDTASIQGAMFSGGRAASAVVGFLGG